MIPLKIQSSQSKFPSENRDVLLPKEASRANAISKQIFSSQLKESKRASLSLSGSSSSSNFLAYPATYNQKQLWIYIGFHPDSLTYNVGIAFTILSSYHIPHLKRFFEILTERHEILRTTFFERKGELFQRVYDHLSIPFEVVDARGFSREKLLEEIVRIRNKKYDLERGPLSRATLFELSDGTAFLSYDIHHIISDGWSFGIFFEELNKIYSALLHNNPLTLAPVTLQNKDLAFWQARFLGSEIGKEQYAHWERELSGLTPLNLPFDRPPLAERVFQGQGVRVAIEKRLVSKAKEIAEREGVTLHTFLLAIYKVLLLRLTHQNDIAINTPIPGRLRSDVGRKKIDFANTMGYFINISIVRSHFKSGSTFVNYLRELQQTVAANRKHQDYPMVSLAETFNIKLPDIGYNFLKARPDDAINPLSLIFDIPNNKVFLDDLVVGTAPVQVPQQDDIFDLNLALIESEGAVHGFFTFRTDVFDKETIQRFGEHFQRIIESVTQNPEVKIEEIPLLAANEENDLLNHLNQTNKVFPAYHSILDPFERQVHLTPHNTAVTSNGVSLTYRDLDMKANQLAHHLKRMGVRPDAFVGVCLERKTDMLVAILGILKAGGAYLMLDASYPSDRLRFMIQDARVSVILTHRSTQGIFDGISVKNVSLDDPSLMNKEPAHTPPKIERSPNHILYGIYTSGSTGTPKGIAIEHAALINHMQWMQETFQFSSDDVFLQKTPTSFDASVWEFYAPLLVGAKLVIAPENTLKDPLALIQLIIDNHVSVIQLVPVMLRTMLQQPQVAQCQSLRNVFVGGDVLQKNDVNTAYQMLPKIQVTNLYGPSECTIDSTFYICPKKPLVSNPPIGVPISNAQIFILDAKQRPVPLGVAGEMYIGGDLVGRGYVNRPDLTQERFIPNPFSHLLKTPAPVLYRTGDLCRYVKGNIEFLGRADDQIKLRGFRIEIGEIEAAFNDHPQIRNAIATIVTHEDNTKQLVGYILPKGEEEIRVSQLNDHLRKRLPNYMIPSVFIALSELPLLPNGKINRKALPKPTLDNILRDSNFKAPTNAVEQKLSLIWSELLHVPQIGIDDHFFQMGGTSIDCIQMVARARQIGIHFSVKDIDSAPTIAQLALRCIINTNQEEIIAKVATGKAPLIPIQSWFFNKKFPNPHHYNQSVLLKPKERLDCHVIEKSLNLVLNNHDSFHLRYRQGPQGWEQSYTNQQNEPVSFDERNLSAVPDAELSQAIEEVNNQMNETLNISEGPLVKACLIECGGRRGQRLSIVTHHLVVDAVSYLILIEEIEATYKQLKAKAEAPKFAPTSTYQEWGLGINNLVNSGFFDQELDYWLKVPQKGLLLPMNTTHSAGIPLKREVRMFSPTTTLKLLRKATEAYQTEINDLLLSALMLATQKWTHKDELYVYFEGHGREGLTSGIDLSRTTGWFTALYPLFLNLPKEKNLGTIIKNTKNQLRQVPNKGIGYGLLRYMRKDHEGAAKLQNIPEPNISFNYLGRLGEDGSLLQIASEPLGKLVSVKNQRKDLIDIHCFIVGERFVINWFYSPEYFNEKEVTTLIDNYQKTLEQLVEHCCMISVAKL